MYAKIFLTFDVEDFINDRSINALYNILELLKKYNFRALFFITGHIAEKLFHFPEILNLLDKHEIGYHSSSHSVRPIIPEYTDLENYHDAYLQALKREVTHINPFTGKIEGKGGIHVLKDLFPETNIVSFRAPGGCWSPPHLDALVNLGLKFDFSTNISTAPVYYRGITFYPYPILIDTLKMTFYPKFMYRLLKNKIIILDLHPSSFINSKAWDSIYYKSNPRELSKVNPKSLKQTISALKSFNLLLKQINLLQEIKLVKVTTNLVKSKKNLSIKKEHIEEVYEKSIWWSRRFFGYEPKFLHNHFVRYFQCSMNLSKYSRDLL